MSISAKYKDLGTMVEGKIEAGILRKDTPLLMMPNKEKIGISALYGETEDEVEQLLAGEQARIRLRGIEEEDISPGFGKSPLDCASFISHSLQCFVTLLDRCTASSPSRLRLYFWSCDQFCLRVSTA
jgi:peptide chain release factor subunit 3